MTDSKTSDLYFDWFSRSCGDWVSYRRYLYGEKRTPDNLVTEFSITTEADDIVTVSWASERNEGVMKLQVDGDVLHRDIGYYSSDPTDSHMSIIDNDTIVFKTSYGGMDYREEIRLLNDDSLRLRQTVGYKDGKPMIVGQYFEERAAVKG